LYALLQTVIARRMKVITRRGVLVADMGQSGKLINSRKVPRSRTARRSRRKASSDPGVMDTPAHPVFGHHQVEVGGRVGIPLA
jgi:hypothetical protein